MVYSLNCNLNIVDFSNSRDCLEGLLKFSIQLIFGQSHKNMNGAHEILLIYKNISLSLYSFFNVFEPLLQI